MKTYLYCYSLHTKLLSTECEVGGRCAVGAAGSVGARAGRGVRGATDEDDGAEDGRSKIFQ